MSMATGKLPDADWKFDNVPPEEIEACFWWEYIRTGLNQGLRKELTQRWRTNPASLADSSYLHGKMEAGGFAFISAQVLRHFCHSFWPTKHEDEMWQRQAKCMWERNAWMDLREGTRFHLSVSFPCNPGSTYGSMITNLEPSNNALIAPKYQLRDSITRVLLNVDWRFKNTEILDELRCYLRSYRPSKWPEPTRRVGQSHFAQYFRPQTHKAALVWLGVLRRAKAGCKWCDFKGVYGATSEEPDLRKAAKWAEHIIAWMSDGDDAHLTKLPAEKTRQRRANG